MKWLPTLCKNCIAKLWMVGIVALVLVALTFSAIRGALPYLNQYQEQVSQELFERYGIHLAMKSVKGFWHNGGPLLVVDELSFENSDKLGVSVSAKQAKLHFDIVESALALSPRFKLIEIDSPHVFLDDLNKLKSEPVAEDEGDSGELLHLTRSAVIKNAKVEFSERFGALPAIDIARVAWHDAIEQRQLQVLLTKDNKQQQPLKLIVDLHGATQHDLRGQVYVKAQDWHWLENLKPLLPLLADNASAQASFELWADFSVGQLDSMMLKLGENNLTWDGATKRERLEFRPELVQWLPYQQGWVFEAKAITPVLNERDLAPLSIAMHRINDRLQLDVESIPVAKLSPVAGLLSSVDKATLTLLEKLKLTGDLKDISLVSTPENLQYRGRLTDFSMVNVDGIPGVKPLTAVFEGSDNAGSVTIEAGEQRLDFGRYFKAPIALNKLNTELNWQLQEGVFTLASPMTQLANDDLSTAIAWQLQFADGHAPTLSLLGDAKLSDAKQAQYYLPHVVLSDELVDYLSGAIKAGHSDNVKLLWQGNVEHFPYTAHQGIFEVNALVKDASFDFDSEWHPVTDATVELLFRNEAMVITGYEGILNNLSFEALTVAIPDLMADTTKLEIRADVKQPQHKINTFVSDSPINDSLGPVLSQLDAKGDIFTKLAIDIPFDGSLPQVSGVVKLKNNDLSIKAIDLDIGKLSGDIAFNGGDISAKNLQGILYQQPVTLALESRPFGDSYGIEVDLDAKWHTNKMPDIWQQYLNPYIDGSLDWQGKLTLKISEDDVYYQSFVRSPMTGLELKLPKPLDKYVDQEEDLLVTSSGNVEGGLFNLALGSRAEVFARIDSSDSSVEVPAITLLVGRKFKAQDEIADNGMTINIDLDSLALDEWQTFIDNIEQGQSKDQFFPPLNRINARVKTLSVLGHDFSDVQLGGAKVDDYWQVQVNSEQATGQLQLFDDWFGKGIVANFDRLVLDKPSEDGNDKAATRESLRELPPLQFNCVSCSVSGFDLGKISFNSAPHLQGIGINNVKVNANESSLSANAIWGFDTDGEYFSVTGDINTKNIESMLAIFDYSTSIKESSVRTNFDLMWRTGLDKLALDSLSGDVKWKLGEGHIAEVSDKGARIFSLFSLDSLRRKLVLDFRDVFQKGIFFNDFAGSFKITDGVAVTEDAHMDGVAGGVDVVGSVNLTSQELDYYISFSPALFSNLPVIAGVAASEPQMFVLTFAITKVLEPIVDVISQVNFKLSGTVDEPNFEEIDRKQKKYKVPEHILPQSKPLTAQPASPEGEKVADEQRQTDRSTTRI
ncbi:MAG: YhdP family protein [Psychrobium sp.]